MSYYVMLLTLTSVAEVSPLKQQTSKNEVLLHRVRTPWITKFQNFVALCMTFWFCLRTQRNKIRKTAPQACPQAIMWAEWTLGMGKVTMCTLATQFGFEFQIIETPHGGKMIGGVFENISHEPTLYLDHLGPRLTYCKDVYPEAPATLKIGWNLEILKSSEANFDCRSIRKKP